jgi:hypothetical protein
MQQGMIDIALLTRPLLTNLTVTNVNPNKGERKIQKLYCFYEAAFCQAPFFVLEIHVSPSFLLLIELVAS